LRLHRGSSRKEGGENPSSQKHKGRALPLTGKKEKNPFFNGGGGKKTEIAGEKKNRKARRTGQAQRMGRRETSISLSKKGALSPYREKKTKKEREESFEHSRRRKIFSSLTKRKNNTTGEVEGDHFPPSQKRVQNLPFRKL